MEKLLLELLWIPVLLAIRLWVGGIVLVSGRSMRETLQHHDVLLVSCLPGRRHHPHRGDVVICRYPGRYRFRGKWQRLRIPQLFIKRVIGLPGETIEIREGQVLIDGRLLSEDYLTPELCSFMRSMPPRQIGTDEVFVMGDYRNCSLDSRRVGPLPLSMLRGRGLLRLYPSLRWI